MTPSKFDESSPAWRRDFPVGFFLLVLLSGNLPAYAAEPAAELPAGVKAVWEFDKAYREQTPTRERVCLNGLWRWQPAEKSALAAPMTEWGFFKVPGPWPGITDYMQKESQTLYPYPGWKDVKPGAASAAWYERSITVPKEWAERRIALQADYVNSLASIYLDGKKVGDIRFPGGELDLTALHLAGGEHRLSMLVSAIPLKGVLLSYKDSASAKEVKGSVPRRGLCGDVYLVSAPMTERIEQVSVITSVRDWEITFQTRIEGLSDGEEYILGAEVKDGQQAAKFTSKAFRKQHLKNGQLSFTAKWKPDRLWDLHTATNAYTLELSLLNARGELLDRAWRTRFGFREMWSEGKDFFLNGSRIYLSAVPLDNAQISAALASYQRARETLERLKAFGINFVYTHNYGCEPGSHLSFDECLKAADDVGMLVSLSQPHFSHYDWQAADADLSNGYARHAEFYARAAGNHPSVVMYSMSHNATGYNEDMNPDLIDGIHDPRDTWALKNSKLALRAEAMVKSLDPSRIVYHHASGNLGSMHAINFYPNFVPSQELSDWFEHWAKTGVKPVFLCEYGAPFTWDWTMYRGWYKDQREFGSAKVPWEFCLAEWNAQFLGDKAFLISEPEKANLRWEARQFKAGNLWHRWDYPVEVGSTRFEERYPVFASYLTDSWRAFRTWGVSATSPWEYGHFWKLRDGVKKSRREFGVDWENLQRPGFSSDYEEQPSERMDVAFERTDWIATPAAEALYRNNRPLLAYLGGKPARFTSKDHNFLPGETVEKQLIAINNSRQAIACDAVWSFGLPRQITGQKNLSIATGDQQMIPLRLDLPANLESGSYPLNARFRFSNGETQEDRLMIHVMAVPKATPLDGKVAVFDPKGETRELLSRLGVRSVTVSAQSDLSGFDLLILGKASLTATSEAPDLESVRTGLKVVVFEQTSEVLEKRLGFRVEEYGLRQLFARVPDHPTLAGLAPEHLSNWRGEASLLPQRLSYQTRPRQGPTVQWCGIPVPRLWRCGNQGNVASVLIEKPARGDFLPILEGGYGLQYSPLLEYHEGKGLMLFCQADVTGRSEHEPAAEALVRNILNYVAAWKPNPGRKAVYVGTPAGKNHLLESGLTPRPYESGRLSENEVLIVGQSGGKELAEQKEAIWSWLKAGGHLLAVGVDPSDLDALSMNCSLKKQEHISAWFEPFGRRSLLAGIGPADLHNRDPRQLFLVASGAEIFGDGVLAQMRNENVVCCQFAPWEFGPSAQANLRRTYRRASFLLTRALANMGVSAETPLLERFRRPVNATKSEKRWLDGFYADQPEEWDDPYRFFRW